MSKKYHHGGYHGTVISGGQVIQSGSGGIGPAGMGGASFSGDPTSYGDSTNNNQTGTNSQSGETGSSGQKEKEILNRLKYTKDIWLGLSRNISQKEKVYMNLDNLH